MDLVRVAKNEVQELLDGCWQTLSSNVNVNHAIAAAVANASSSSSSSSAVSAVASAVGASHSSDNDGIVGSMSNTSVPPPAGDGDGDGDDGGGEGGRSPVRSKDPSPTDDLSGNNDDQSMTDDPSATNNSFDNYRRETRERDRETQAPMSGVVSQLFSGSSPSDICVDGMPIGAIRNLVTRQLSMALQLLLQLLLSSDERSECFTKCYTSIMELSNLRESAMKKAKLMLITLQNLADYQSSMRGQKCNRHHHLSAIGTHLFPIE